MTTLPTVPAVESVNIPFHTSLVDAGRHVQANDTMTRAADAMLDELLRVESAMRPRRRQGDSAAADDTLRARPATC